MGGPLSGEEVSTVPKISASPLLFADIAVDVPTPDRDTFTYKIPDGMVLQPGHLVNIPFGRRQAVGIVVKLQDAPIIAYTKFVHRKVFSEPVLGPKQIQLGQWVSRYYFSPLFEALAPMLPPGYRRPKMNPARLVANHASDDPNQSIDAGLKLERIVKMNITIAEASDWVKSHKTRMPKQSQLLQWLYEHEEQTHLEKELRKRYGATIVRRLIDQDLVKLEPYLNRNPQSNSSRQNQEPELSLTLDQDTALDEIKLVLDNPKLRPRVIVLHGITGSGKTEVYLQAIAHCLSSGRRAVMLIPDLALAPQTLERINARFPGRVGVLHSGLTPNQHANQWWLTYHDSYDVIVGSRSAIFAPVRDLGLIVIDESHEWTYKQEDALPKYHSREVAQQLSELTGATMILGSATPDITDEYKARKGDYRLAKLPNRIFSPGGSHDLPPTSIVDMREELRLGNRSILSHSLQIALASCIKTNHQAILFLNRRGTAGVVQCRACGFVVRCWICGIPYTHHGELGLRCHHCNRRRSTPSTCPQCHGSSIRFLGLGTQKIVQEVERLHPNARVIRWDSDSAKTIKVHQQLMETWANHEADILVGTQMIAKGMHIPNVTLVGIVLADVGLLINDFRAAERTYQALRQVAGRTGRGDDPGKVIIQTYLPDHYAVQAAADVGKDSFYDRELAFRKSYRYPPLVRLIRLVYTHANPTTSRQESSRMAMTFKRLARQWGMNRIDIIGPAPAYPPRNKRGWQWQLLLRGDNPHLLLNKVTIPPKWSIDVDPMTLS